MAVMGDFTNFYGIYKDRQTNVWWPMNVFRLHCDGSPPAATILTFSLNTSDAIHHQWSLGQHSFTRMTLTHWGRATHICVGKLTIIGSDNGLSPGRSQAIIWTNAGILLIGPLVRNKLQWNFNRNSNIFIQENARENIICEMASILSRLQWP